MNRNRLDTKLFKTDTPVLPDVKILNTWAYYDGPLFGVCEVHGKKFFFIDVIYDIWRYYEDESHDRLWAIYAVYDIPIEKAQKIVDSGKDRTDWQSEVGEESECIGIFWEYKYE